MDLEEGMEKIKQTIQTFRMFKNTFSTCQEKLACDRRNDHSVKQWDFPSHLVFSRMDKILRRLLHIEVEFLTFMVSVHLDCYNWSSKHILNFIYRNDCV